MYKNTPITSAPIRRDTACMPLTARTITSIPLAARAASAGVATSKSPLSRWARSETTVPSFRSTAAIVAAPSTSFPTTQYGGQIQSSPGRHVHVEGRSHDVAAVFSESHHRQSAIPWRDTDGIAQLDAFRSGGHVRDGFVRAEWSALPLHTGKLRPVPAQAENPSVYGLDPRTTARLNRDRHVAHSVRLLHARSLPNFLHSLRIQEASFQGNTAILLENQSVRLQRALGPRHAGDQPFGHSGHQHGQ